MARLSIAIIVSAIMLSIVAVLSSASGTQLNAYLTAYIPNSTINSAAFYNQSVNGTSYIVMQTGSNYIVIENSSGSYSIITNESVISTVLSPFLNQKYYPTQAMLSYLNATMLSYQKGAAPQLNYCMVSSGLNLYSCNLTTNLNTCLVNTCQRIPSCGGYLKSPEESELQAYGVPSSFTNGLVNLSIVTTKLNRSYASYFAVLHGINGGNAGASISSLSTIVANISAAASSISINYLFTPPSNATFTACNPLLPPTKQPPLCISNWAQYCQAVPFNNTELSSISAELSSIGSTLPSSSGIASLAASSSGLAKGYINAYAFAKNGTAFSAFLAVITPQINRTTTNADTLLAVYDSSSLNESLRNLRDEFELIKSNGVNQSISAANATLERLIANTTAAYNAANGTYSQAYLAAQSNSAAILARELSYREVPYKVAVLASDQESINMQLNSRVNSSDVSTIVPALQGISQQLSSTPAAFSAALAVKSAYGSVIGAILGPYNTPIPQKMASAPLYVAIGSLVIGLIIIIIAIAIVYMKAVDKGKLRQKGSTAWIVAFVIVLAIVVIFIYSTYSYAGSAATFLPFSGFINAIKSSKTAYIALNGSAASNASVTQCASTITSELTNASKTVQTIKLQNYSCVSGSNISVLGINCYNSILQSNRPVIYMSAGGQEMIAYRGLYGTVLYASGSAVNGKYCTLGTLFRNIG